MHVHDRRAEGIWEVRKRLTQLESSPCGYRPESVRANGRTGHGPAEVGPSRFLECTETELGKDREQVVALFDALEKQVRSGYFELPNTLDLSGGAG